MITKGMFLEVGVAVDQWKEHFSDRAVQTALGTPLVAMALAVEGGRGTKNTEVGYDRGEQANS